MAVTFDANATASVTANAVTSITSSNLTVGSGTNRVLVVQIAWSASVSAVTVNWDQLGTPQACTLITNASATNTYRADLYGLVAPTSGAKQAKAAWTTSRDVIMNQLSYTGADQTGGNTTFPHGTSNTGGGINTGSTVTVTSATNNAVVAAHATDTNVLSVDNTQTYINNTPTGCSSGGNRAAGASTVTLTASWVSTTINWASVGTDIAVLTVAGDTQEWRGCYPPPRCNTSPNIMY